MIVTLLELKAVLGIEESETEKDALLSRILAATQKYAENFTDRKRFDLGAVEKTIEGDGAKFLYLHERPAFFDFDGGDFIKVDGVEIPRESVVLYSEAGKVVLLDGYKFTEGKKVELKYSGGWGFTEPESPAVPESLAPDDLKNCLLEIAAATYREKGGVLAEKQVGDFKLRYDTARNVSEAAEKTLEFYSVSKV